MRLDDLAREGALDVLRRLCLAQAKFKDLNKEVSNTRTLTRRLKELRAAGLVTKAEDGYRITDEGFEMALKTLELEGTADQQPINQEELAKIRYRWMRIPLSRLADLLHSEFSDELVSLVVYGSAAKGSFQLGRSDLDLFYVLKDNAQNTWQREENVFRLFETTWEYRACNHWLKTQGTYGYPEITTAWLSKTQARTFQPIYLDMLLHRTVLIDKDRFFHELMKRLEEALRPLGTIRIENPDGTHRWILKPDIAPGELIEIDLG